MIDTFYVKMDTDYNVSIDINKNFEEQELLGIEQVKEDIEKINGDIQQ